MPQILIKCSNNTLQILASDFDTYKKLRTEVIAVKPEIVFSSHVRLSDNFYKMEIACNEGSMTALKNFVKLIPNLNVAYAPPSSPADLMNNIIKILGGLNVKLIPAEQAPARAAPDTPKMKRTDSITPPMKSLIQTTPPAKSCISLFGLFWGSLPTRQSESTSSNDASPRQV